MFSKFFSEIRENLRAIRSTKCNRIVFQIESEKRGFRKLKKILLFRNSFYHAHMTELSFRLKVHLTSGFAKTLTLIKITMDIYFFGVNKNSHT